jgi:hypothetical protein
MQCGVLAVRMYAVWRANSRDGTKQNKTCLQTFLFQLQTSNNERLLINFYVHMNCFKHSDTQQSDTVRSIQTHSNQTQYVTFNYIYQLTANKTFLFCRPTPPTY